MRVFRRQMTGALAAGALAGVVLFLIQWILIAPLIRQADTYERLDAVHADGRADAGWEPSDGFERIAYTGVGTVLAGVGFGTFFFGVASLIGVDLNARTGLWMGAAGFFCFAIVPSIGLPPKPPGVPGPTVQAAQLWWVTAAACSCVALWVFTHAGRSKGRLGISALALAVPFLIGAPPAQASSVVPLALVWRFAAISIATRAVFWMTLGVAGGRMMHGCDRA
ncbi:MAG TPA: CbtA family protein [Vicinamibacterales bacterium]|nr:CbtA family protein [Vicinamibacterales bacterium]